MSYMCKLSNKECDACGNCQPKVVYCTCCEKAIDCETYNPDLETYMCNELCYECDKEKYEQEEIEEEYISESK